MDNFLGRTDGQMQCRGMLHIVEAGDTLYKIARKYGVPLSRVIYANPYVNVYNLQAGDEICVPVMVPRTPAQNPMSSEMERGGGAGADMPQSQMEQENRMGNGAMPSGQMGYGVLPGVQREDSQAEDLNHLQKETEENGPQEKQMDLAGEHSVPKRDSFAELQETEKMQQSDELQLAYERASGSGCDGQTECMPWENTVVTESMMEDYLSVSR